MIEGKGMYVMPGLIDVHIHINSSKDVPAEYIYKLLLGHGVTTVRTFNVGNDDPAGMVAEKKKIAANQIIAPRMYVYPFWGRGDDPRYSNPEGARQIVDEWHALGRGRGQDYWQARIVAGCVSRDCGSGAERWHGRGCAHRAGRRVSDECGAGGERRALQRLSITMGIRSLRIRTRPFRICRRGTTIRASRTGFWRRGGPGCRRTWAKLHGEVIQSLLETMHRTGFIMVPTFSIYEANRDVTRAANLPWHSTYTLPVVMDSFLPNPAHHASYFYEWTSNKEADWARAYRRWLDFVNDYKNQGGVVAVGSDTGFLFELWGFGTIRELEMLEEAGFSPLEALHAATENGAKVVKNPELGLVRQGYLADLVVLSENPLADVKVFYGNGVTRVGTDRKEVHEQCVKYTIRDGVIFDSQALLSDVREMVSEGQAGAASADQTVAVKQAWSRTVFCQKE